MGCVDDSELTAFKCLYSINQLVFLTRRRKFTSRYEMDLHVQQGTFHFKELMALISCVIFWNNKSLFRRFLKIAKSDY